MAREEREAPVERVRAAAGLIYDEFLATESSADAAVSVDELRAGELLPEFVKRVVEASWAKTDAERRGADALLSSLVVRGAVEAPQVEAGLELVLKGLDAAQAEVPRCGEYAAATVAHLLEDKVLPEAILGYLPALVGEKQGQAVLEQVKGALKLPLPITKFKEAMRSVVDEYFVSGDVADTAHSLAALGEKRFGHVVVKRVVAVALEKRSAEREAASLLLSGLTRVYGSEQFFEGFIRALRGIDDLALDTPNVCPLLANFIARAIVDDVLPPGFMSFVPTRLVEKGRGAEVASLVKGLMEQHSSTRIMNVWGVGARRSVEELKESVAALVEEYYVEGELDEAVRCVHELGVPHFGHEVVKRTVYRAVEKGGPALTQAKVLLQALRKKGELEGAELTKGMSRVVMGLPDLSLDVPDAVGRLAGMVEEGVKEGLFEASLAEHLTNMAAAIKAN